jgi:hypothetical protein
MSMAPPAVLADRRGAVQPEALVGSVCLFYYRRTVRQGCSRSCDGPPPESPRTGRHRARITFADGCYTVPSQSGNESYTVILGDDGALCDCPDFGW